MSVELQQLELRLRNEYSANKTWGLRLVENFIGGLSLSMALYFFYTLITSNYWLDNWQFYAYIGLITFGLINCIRFFADELGIPYLFYKLGALSKQQIIDNLIIENKELIQKISMQQTDVAVKEIDRTNSVYKAALKITKMFYSGFPIDRQTCANHGIRESEWNNARELLVKAGIVNINKSKSTELTPTTYAEAKQALMEILK